MKNIFTEPYEESPEQRLQNRLRSRAKNTDKAGDPQLSPDQKRKLKTLNPHDKLYYIRHLGTSNIDRVTE